VKFNLKQVRNRGSGKRGSGGEGQSRPQRKVREKSQLPLGGREVDRDSRAGDNGGETFPARRTDYRLRNGCRMSTCVEIKKQMWFSGVLRKREREETAVWKDKHSLGWKDDSQTRSGGTERECIEKTAPG